MTSLDQAKKRRTHGKAQLTRAEKSAQEIITGFEGDKDSDLSVTRIEFMINEYQSKLNTYDQRQEEFELLLEEEDLYPEIEEAANFRQEKVNTLIRLREISTRIGHRKPSDLCSEDVNTRSSSSKHEVGVSARLPKLELPKFRGDCTQFYPFFDKFTVIIDQGNLPTINKFTYLQSLLEGEALSCIQGLSLTASNYEKAKHMLKERFGRKDKIIYEHVSAMLNIHGVNSCIHGDLWGLYDRIQVHVRELENLEITGKMYGVILAPLILSRLPPNIRMEWARNSEGREGDLDFLMEFLYSEIKRRERSSVFDDSDRREKKKQVNRPTASALVVAQGHKSCVFCNKEHFSDQCGQLKGLSYLQRREKVRGMQRCFRCLRNNHFVRSCKARLSCIHCKGAHHPVYCQRKCAPEPCEQRGMSSNVSTGVQAPRADPPATDTQQSSHTYYSTSGTRSTLLQVLLVNIEGQRLSVLLDTGCDRSYIRTSTAKRLGLQSVGQEYLELATFGGFEVSSQESKTFRVQLGTGLELTLLGTKEICRPLYRSPVPCEILNSFQDLNITEDLSRGYEHHIDILIGMDHYYEILLPGTLHAQGLVAQKTIWGWFLAGSYANQGGSRVTGPNTFLHCLNLEPTETLIRKAWELDSIGICNDSEPEASEVQALNELKQSIQYEGGRYRVGLPWKSERHKEMLLDNLQAATRRLNSLYRKLEATELESKYQQVFVDWEAAGIVEEVPQDEYQGRGQPIFYLPHRPVVREDSLTTKIRPVFDASAKGANGLSLNDCVEVGPNLIPDLFQVLLRFRRWSYGLTADITKAFLQIELKEEDRDVHRFLLKKGDEVRIMRFTRVTFGNASSPFLLNATLKHHLSQCMSKDRAIQELSKNLYVDDFITGADTEEELIHIMEKSEMVLRKGGFPLTKWMSNSNQLREKVITNKPFSEAEVGETRKVLGVIWNTNEDCFQFETTVDSHHLVYTKRNTLGIIARLFDPLGLMTPFTVSLKILFQDIWRLGFEWDAPLSDELQDEIEGWVSGLKEIRNLKVPRRLTSSSWKDADSVELIVFCDASEKAYGCVVYLRTRDEGDIVVRLVTSKVRVAPLKKVTLPRLELLAAVLGARLFKSVRNSLELPEDTPYSCWTDSKITEGWIKGDPSRWKQFVRNRVVEIHQLTDPTRWKHVPGKENPADLLTRGVSAGVLTRSSLWLCGPDWLLSEYPEPSPEIGENGEENTALGEEKQDLVTVCAMAPESNRLIEFERFGSFEKLLRVTALVIKFVKILRTGKSKKTVSSGEEMRQAKVLILKEVQNRYYSTEIADIKRGGTVSRQSSLLTLAPFLDDEGFLRVKGRLSQSPDLSYDEKHPIILPKCHVSFLLVRSHHEFMKHAGVGTLISSLRGKYWIISVRTLAKRVIGGCIRCKRHDARLLYQQTAPLPEDRVKQTSAFDVTGVDYCGPVFCGDTGNKHYILLFTCAVTRAVHLELTDSLSAEDFVLAFRKFVSRRALPSIIYSDNARTFKAASELLLKHFSKETLVWKNICPLSPNWGGFWERMVRSVKSSLRKSIGKQSLNRRELETVLVEIEACINSRPLKWVSDEEGVLTPSHFLIGRGSPLTSAELKNIETVSDLSERKKSEESLLKQFWQVWRDDYLRNLPLLSSKKATRSLKVGCVVLVKETGKPRLFWPLGKVVKLYPGIDGLVRAVRIKTSSGEFTRSIQHLCLLETTSLEETVNNSVEDSYSSDEQGESVPICSHLEKEK